MVKRTLFLINTSSATGHSDTIVARLHTVLTECLGRETDLKVKTVKSHRRTKTEAAAFLAAEDTPALIIAGGGGGTLRAAIEGICENCEPGRLPGPDRVRITCLRMGSGNLLARQFGIPREPETGLKGIAANLRADRTAPCCVMRYEIGKKNAAPEIRYAATLGGFGQFGRIPRDLAFCHRRFPRLYRGAASLLGIERLTQLEYGLALLIRSALCALRPRHVEVIEIRLREHTESMRLLAGAAINFPFKALPCHPDVRAENSAVSLNFIPYRGRYASLFLALSPRRLAEKGLRIRLVESDRVDIRLINRDSVDFFLDEDPLVFHNRMKIQVAGTLAFVPGPDYSWSSDHRPNGLRSTIHHPHPC